MVQSCTNGLLKNGKMYSIIHEKPGEPDDSEALRVQVFMLSADGELDSPTLQAILDSGHSRIPIHRGADRWDCCSEWLKNPVGTIGAFAASAPSCSQAAACEYAQNHAPPSPATIALCLQVNDQKGVDM